MTRLNTYALPLFSCFLLLTLAPAAHAVDGVILINQSTSINGLPGCPHSGFPIIICQSGSYRLSGNLTITGADTSGVFIEADNVTLDLNGFAVTGPVTCKAGTYPVQCSGTTGLGFALGIFAMFNYHNITIRNGTVRGIDGDGIHAEGYGIEVDSVHVESNYGVGIFVFWGVVTHSSVTANRLDGITGLTGAASTISQNTVTYNGGNGISYSSVVTGNTSSLNGQDGILNSGAVLNNGAFGNIGWGIRNATGYGGNVAAGNGLGAITGGASMHNNICNGAGC